MSQRGLEALLRPKSIAVIGASMKPQRAGYLMMRNLLAGGFNGPVMPVTPAWKAVLGVLAWPTIESLPFTPDLAVLCTNARRNRELLEALGQKGCKTCIILSSQPEQYPALLECAARYQMRLLGPNSLGLLAPWQGLNASFSPVPIHRGKLAFISQSAAVSNTILDWAQQREMGFSSSSPWVIAWILMSMTCWTFWPATARPAPFCCTSSISATRAALSPPRAALRETNLSW